MINTILKFSTILTIVLLIVFGLHLTTLHFIHQPIFDNQLIDCYIFNYILAIITVIVLTFLQHKVAGSLGFIFMGGGLVKFALFFAIFYPSFKADGDINRLEFCAFFIPYAISLISEVFFLSKTLNK